MKGRNRLLGLAALAFGGAFALHTVEYAFRLADVLSAPHSTGLVVAECLGTLIVGLNLGTTGLLAAAVAGAALASCAAAICVIAALQPAFARALQRLRSGPSNVLG